MNLTNRTTEATLTKSYMQAQELFYDGVGEPEYTKVVEVDLGSVVASIAGPSRPQDRIDLDKVKTKFQDILKCDYGREIYIKDMGNFDNESINLSENYSDSCTIESGMKKLRLR